MLSAYVVFVRAAQDLIWQISKETIQGNRVMTLYDHALPLGKKLKIHVVWCNLVCSRLKYYCSVFNYLLFNVCYQSRKGVYSNSIVMDQCLYSNSNLSSFNMEAFVGIEFCKILVKTNLTQVVNYF